MWQFVTSATSFVRNCYYCVPTMARTQFERSPCNNNTTMTQTLLLEDPDLAKNFSIHWSFLLDVTMTGFKCKNYPCCVKYRVFKSAFIVCSYISNDNILTMLVTESPLTVWQYASRGYQAICCIDTDIKGLGKHKKNLWALKTKAAVGISDFEKNCQT